MKQNSIDDIKILVWYENRLYFYRLLEEYIIISLKYNKGSIFTSLNFLKIL